MWVSQLGRIGHSQFEGINRESEIVVLGLVGDMVGLMAHSGQGQ